jgi:hypothetical protein
MWICSDLVTVTVPCQNLSFKTCKNNNNNHNQETSTHLFVRHLQRVLLFFVFNRGDGPLNDFFNAAGPLIGNDCVLAMVVVGNGCVLAMILLLAMIISFEEQRKVEGVSVYRIRCQVPLPLYRLCLSRAFLAFT